MTKKALRFLAWQSRWPNENGKLYAKLRMRARLNNIGRYFLLRLGNCPKNCEFSISEHLGRDEAYKQIRHASATFRISISLKEDGFFIRPYEEGLIVFI